MTPISALLSNIVDYAGLFPPAELPLDSVVDNYRQYSVGPSQWMLARLILPSGKLDQCSVRLAQSAESSGWRISALIPPVDAPDGAFDAALSAISRFNAENDAQVDALEGKLSSVDQLASTLGGVPEDFDLFLEIDYQAPDRLISEIARAGRPNLHAKIRCGGVTEDLIPSSAEIARFLLACAAEQVGFKATAGLHHPLRAIYPLTYADDSPRAAMHGFLNVFLAACFAYTASWSAESLIKLLDEQESDSISVEEDALVWRERRATAKQLREVREQWATSFGSCSFEEPVRDLQSLGLIAPALKV